MNQLLRIVGIACGLAISLSSQGYGLDGHYYAVSMALIDVNGGKPLPPDLITIATSVQFVDDDSKTMPNYGIFPSNAESRRTFHFAAETLPLGFFGTVKRNSPFAKHNVNKALQANDPYWLGMSLHTYTDSFAHEGYEAYAGQIINGNDADRPHLNPDKFKELVTYLYAIAEKWQSNNGMPIGLGKLTPDQFRSWAAFTPTGYQCAGAGVVLHPIDCFGYNYDKDELTPRVDYWTSQINQQFPGSLVTYSFLTGDKEASFDSVIPKYSVPTTATEAISTEWESIAKSASRLAKHNAASVTTKKVTDRKLARQVLNKPEISPDGLPRQLRTSHGISTLLLVADQVPNGWYNLSRLMGYGDGPGVSLDEFTPRFAAYLTSKKLEKRLFGMAVLSSSKNAGYQRICGRIGALLNQVNTRNMTLKQRTMLLKSLVPDSYWITQCAQATPMLLNALLDDPYLGSIVSAREYLISQDEGHDSLHSSDPRVIESMRLLRDSVQQDVYNHAYQGLGAYGQMPEAAKADQLFWATRSLEDTDDEDHGSLADKKHLSDLAVLLEKYISTGNVDLVQAICSAVATYDPTDLPDEDLSLRLLMILGDDRFKTIRAEVAYALQQITGKKINIASYWTM
ncbi:MAG: hypothetical protein ACK443_05035 [Methylococcaceae bacterium]